MSAPLKIPMPLRVPELGPALGRVIVPRRLIEPWIPLDDIRERLATRVLELGGEARAATLREQREAVLEAVSRRAWAGAWEPAVRAVAERLAAAIDAELEGAARRVRMPRRRRRRRLLTGAEKRAIAARLAAGGGPFVDALDALEAAWLALEDEVAEERARWAPEIAAVAAWRPALWPVFALWVPLTALLLWLGLVLGGYLSAPPWLAGRLGF